jgi:hypothetical protein
MVIKTAPVSVNFKSEDKCVQVKVRRKAIVQGYSGGTLLWCTPSQARDWVDQNAVDIVGGTMPPDEVAAEDSGKSSSGQPTGLSTDSQPSPPSGVVEQSSSSVEGQASEQQSSSESGEQGGGTTAESSQSTTHTPDAPTQTSSTSQTPDGGSGTESEQGSGNSAGSAAPSRGRGRR